MDSKISIFGHSGFIGSKFCELYTDRIIKIDRNQYFPQSNNILYFISTTDNYNVYDNLHLDVETNLQVLMRVLDNIKNTENIIFNFVSSWFVYGQANCLPFNEETTICNPTGFYSITKYCAEKLLISFCKTYNIRYRVLRLCNVIGENDKKVSIKKNALQYFIKQIINDENIRLYHNGQSIRDYLHINDVCNALKFCVDKAPINEIINIGRGKPILLRTLIEKAIEYSKSKSQIIDIEPTPFHKIVQIQDAYLDITKLLSFGFDAKFTDIDTIIEQLVDYYKENKNEYSVSV